MSTVEDIAQIAEACAVRPGDVLVISFERDISRQEFDQFAELIKAAVPETVKVLVVGGSVHLHVLRASGAAQ